MSKNIEIKAECAVTINPDFVVNKIQLGKQSFWLIEVEACDPLYGWGRWQEYIEFTEDRAVVCTGSDCYRENSDDVEVSIPKEVEAALIEYVQDWLDQQTVEQIKGAAEGIIVTGKLLSGV